MNILIARTITADGAPASAAAQANSQQPLKLPSDYDLTTLLDGLISGWHDLRSMPWISLCLGSAIATLAIGGRHLVESNPQLLLPAVIGAIAVSPFLVALFSSLSRELHTGRQPSLGAAVADVRSNRLALGTLALILTLVAIAGLRLTAIAVALTLDYSVSVSLFEAPISGGLGPTLAVAFAATGLGIVLLAVTMLGVPALHDRCVADLNTGLLLPRRGLRAVLLWLLLIFTFGAAAIWVTPLLLIVGVPLLAYANRHAVRRIVTDESLHCA